jgi:hypothetical protein
MKQFNINATVKVRLTKFGKELHKKQWEDFWSSCNRLEDFPYDPPKQDENGYVEFQMWELMETFGGHIGLCKEPAFDTVILIDDKNLKNTSPTIKPKKAVIEVDCPIDDFHFVWDHGNREPTQEDYDKWAIENAVNSITFSVKYEHNLDNHIKLK